MEFHWPRCTLPPHLNADEVHVWAISLDVADSAIGLLAEWLSADERRRAERFHFEHVRRRFIASHGALRQLLGRYLEIDPADVALTTDDKGKPRIAGAEKNLSQNRRGMAHFAESSEQNVPVPLSADDFAIGPRSDKTCILHFNLSHSGELALVAIASEVEVGVDVEQVRAVSNIERLARRYFHAAEADEVLAAEGNQQDLLFMRCWTAKEAVMKAYGSGIGAGLNRFRVPLDESFTGWIDLSALPEPFTHSRCWLSRLAPCEGSAAACALVGDERKVRAFTFSA